MTSFRIAFTGTHSRSVTFANIARRLAHAGVEIFWIMPGAKHRINHIIEQGFSPERILNLAEIDKSYCSQSIERMEAHSRITASQMIINDRLLSGDCGEKALGYLGGVFRSVSKFITDNRIDIVFSEATWAYEMSVCAACSASGADFIVPHTVRIPSGRFAFFRGIFQDELIRNGRSGRVLPMPSRFQAEKGYIPPALISKRHFLSFFSHMYRFIRGSAKDETEQTVFQLAGERLMRAFNGRMAGFDRMPAKPDGDYVLLPLHISPESSLDVLGGMWNNQQELIRCIARSLPHGVKLAVREHPAGIGRRDFRFFSETASIYNVVNVSPYSDNAGLIKNAKAVISVSGSACYEAAFVGVGSVVFSDVFFSSLPTVFRCRSAEDIGRVLKEAMNARPDRHALAEFLADITQNSYEGCVESAEVAPQAMSEENARRVAQAFMDFLENYSASERPLYAASMSSR